MIDKKLVMMMYRNRNSYASIGRYVGVTRQRIHQIITGYRTKKYRSKKLLKKLNNGCAICHQKADMIHHIDNNCRNNDPKNIMPICTPCHYKLHLSDFTKKIIKSDFPTMGRVGGWKENRWSKRYSECIVCGDNKRKYGGRGMCSRCYQRFAYYKRKEKF